MWRCVDRIEKGGPDCDARTVKEELLQEVGVKAVNEMLGGKDTFLPVLQENIEAVIDDTSGAAIAAINEKLAGCQKELPKLTNAKEDYVAADESGRPREEKQSILVDNAERESTRQRVQELIYEVFFRIECYEGKDYNKHDIQMSCFA